MRAAAKRSRRSVEERLKTARLTLPCARCHDERKLERRRRHRSPRRSRARSRRSPPNPPPPPPAHCPSPHRRRDRYAVVVQVVRALSVARVARDVVESAPHPCVASTLARVRETFGAELDDDEVAASSTRLSLRCPVGLQASASSRAGFVFFLPRRTSEWCPEYRGQPQNCVLSWSPSGGQPISTPVRGARCTHLQCFDLRTFLEMNQAYSAGRWRCPVCSRVTHPAALRVDRCARRRRRRELRAAASSLVCLRSYGRRCTHS